ncbi:MAG: MBL fold metallo-hydrolase [Desulfosarcinaceae bacterium]|nr:MBL fold metallo-hydrolase [Desulfosarcinaceae bacterium]
MTTSLADPLLSQMSIRSYAERRLHHMDGGYRNPFNPNQRRGLWRFLKWRLFSENAFRSQYQDETVRPVTLEHLDGAPPATPDITYLNHASVFLRDGHHSLLLDPVFNGISSFIRNYTPLTSVPPSLRRPDVVLVSHGHYDHLDTDSLAMLDPATPVVAPLGYGPLFAELGLVDLTSLDWYETCEVAGWRITCLPAHHWTMRNPIVGPNRSLWSGFKIESPSGYRIYLSGDTAYFNGYDQLAELGPFDLAVFNLGAYEPRWFMRHSHLDPAECVTAYGQLGARWLLPIHWGSFRLGDEPVFLPPLALEEEMAARSLAERLVVLPQGAAWKLT